MAEVFLSYTQEDRPLALRIASALRRLGLGVSSDADERFERRHGRLSDQILEASLVIVLWTPDSVRRSNVHRDAKLGRARDNLINVLVGVSKAPRPFDRSESFGLNEGAEPTSGERWTGLVQFIERRLVEGGDAVPGELTYRLVPREGQAAPTEPPARFLSLPLSDLLTTPLSLGLLSDLSRRGQPTTVLQWVAATPTGWDRAAYQPPPPPPPEPRLLIPVASRRRSGDEASFIGPLVLVLAAAAIGVFGLAAWAAAHFSRELTGLAAAAAKMLHLSAMSGPAGASASAVDTVDVSVFAPPNARPGDQLLVQVYLHAIDDEPDLLAVAADPTSQRRGRATLDVALQRGERVDIVIDAGGVEIDEPIQSLVWRGWAHSVGFLVTIPTDCAHGPVQFRIRVLRASIPIGQVRFALPIRQNYRPEGLTLVGDSATRFNRAFLSYAREDRVEVLKRAQALRAARIDFFQDLLSIRTGEEWEHRLEEEIDVCDLFLLFWSEAARKSTWVAREIDRAANRRDFSPDHVPEIMPVMLEGPPPPPPPERLKHLHFDDVISYLIAANDRHPPAAHN